MSRAPRRRRIALLASAMTLVALAGSAGGAAAHSHVIGKNGQVIANGQNHPVFDPVTFESCLENGLLPGFGPAWYGLETAHHGPDSGDPGKGDGCYKADFSPGGELDDVNPAID